MEQVVLDGFFARTSIGDVPRESRKGGLQEFGLPYASDPVVSKHIAQFLSRSLQNVKASEKLAALVGTRAAAEALIPTAVLFNGGVFKAELIRARVLDLLASWNGGQPVCELQVSSPTLPLRGSGHLRALLGHGQGHSHQGRHGAVLLYRPGDFHACDSRL